MSFDAGLPFPADSEFAPIDFDPSVGAIAAATPASPLEPFSAILREEGDCFATSLGVEPSAAAESEAVLDIISSMPTSISRVYFERVNEIFAGNTLGGGTVDQLRGAFEFEALGAIAGGNRPISSAAPAPPPEIDPPELNAGLLEDTGIEGDGITRIGAIGGLVSDNSEVGLLRLISPGNSSDVEIEADGNFTLDRAALEAAIGEPLVDGETAWRLLAFDEFGNRAEFELNGSSKRAVPGAKQ